jgi:hypothetical protein
MNTTPTGNEHKINKLTDIPNIGPAMTRDLNLLGIQRPEQLRGRDPYRLYEELNRMTGKRQDPCVLDVFIAAVRFMAGEPARPWWHYTAERKATLQRKSPSARSR